MVVVRDFGFREDCCDIWLTLGMKVCWIKGTGGTCSTDFIVALENSKRCDDDDDDEMTAKRKVNLETPLNVSIRLHKCINIS